MSAHFAMAESSIQLVYRNAQLEAELHAAKVQLHELQGVNSYLLRVLASGAVSALPPTPPSTPLKVEHMPHADLISFPHDRSSRTIEVAVGNSKPKDLNISRENELDPSLWKVKGPTRNHDRPQNVTVGRGIGNLPLSDNEYRRLKGASCFVEEMDPHERKDFWQKFAMGHATRNARAWESMYNREVRPALAGDDTQGDDIHKAGEDLISMSPQSDPSSSETAAAARSPMLHAETQALRHEPIDKAEIISLERQDPAASIGPAAHACTGLLDDSHQPAATDSETTVQHSSHEEHTHPNFKLTVRDHRYPDVHSLFYHGSDQDCHPFRTVLISGVPPGVSLTEVLQQIRRGKVISAKLLQTSLMKLATGVMGMNTAMVVFGDGREACAFVESTAGAISIGCIQRIRSTLSPVTLVPTKSRLGSQNHFSFSQPDLP